MPRLAVFAELANVAAAIVARVDGGRRSAASRAEKAVEAATGEVPA